MKIEEEPDLSGYIDDRDAELGASHIKNLENALNSCRKVVIILSKKCLDSPWFEFQLSQTVWSMLHEPVVKNKVIPIKIEDDLQIPPSLSHLHSIEYRDTPLFWNRLIKAIRYNSAS